jgi:hypothetical protein
MINQRLSSNRRLTSSNTNSKVESDSRRSIKPLKPTTSRPVSSSLMRPTFSSMRKDQRIATPPDENLDLNKANGKISNSKTLSTANPTKATKPIPTSSTTGNGPQASNRRFSARISALKRGPPVEEPVTRQSVKKAKPILANSNVNAESQPNRRISARISALKGRVQNEDLNARASVKNSKPAQKSSVLRNLPVNSETGSRRSVKTAKPAGKTAHETRKSHLKTEKRPSVVKIDSMPKESTAEQKAYFSHSRKSVLERRLSVVSKVIPSSDSRRATELNSLSDKLRLKDLKIAGPLGQGALGSVWLVKERDSGFYMALKAMRRSNIVKNNLMDQIIREVNNQFPLRHPNIIRTFDYYFDSDSFYILQEAADFSQLFNLISKHNGFPEARAAKYTAQIADVLWYLRLKNIIHRDLKPENLLLDSLDNIKLSDFGWSICLEDPKERRKTYCGTLDYFSPEIIEPNKSHSFSTDYWSMGCIIFEMLTGKPPFETRDKPSTMRRIANVQYTCPPHMSELAKDLISKLLVRDSNQRLTPKQVIEHPWIKKNCPNFQCFTKTLFSN